MTWLCKFKCCFYSWYFRKMLTFLRNPISQGYEWSFWPDAKFLYHYRIYRPLRSLYYDWPITTRDTLSHYWPSSRLYRYYLNDLSSSTRSSEETYNSYKQSRKSTSSSTSSLIDFPSEEAYRKIRVGINRFFVWT